MCMLSKKVPGGYGPPVPPEGGVLGGRDPRKSNFCTKLPLKTHFCSFSSTFNGRNIFCRLGSIKSSIVGTVDAGGGASFMAFSLARSPRSPFALSACPA